MALNPKVDWPRDVYTEHPAVTARRDGEVSDWRYDQRIRVTGARAPKPVTTFLEAAFPEFITAELEAMGFDRPTPIQSQSWPVALSGRDMIGLASTGSGKTLCFALPAMVHIVAQEHLRPGDGPVAVMLAPTRELAMQIKGECDRFGASSGVKNAAIFGGVPKGPQQRDLQHGIEICIATPGRLQDFLDGGFTNMRRCTWLVLDEADRMLDLGFEPQLRGIIAGASPERVTMMFSATWPREVQALSRSIFRREPLMVQVNEAADLRAADTIEQRFEVVEEREKHGRFLEVLAGVCDGQQRILIFCGAKRGCEALKAEVRRRGVACETLHGDKIQQARGRASRRSAWHRARVLACSPLLPLPGGRSRR
jgi:ATP-dependent RNA helicase DDX5/DBP2